MVATLAWNSQGKIGSGLGTWLVPGNEDSKWPIIPALAKMRFHRYCVLFMQEQLWQTLEAIDLLTSCTDKLGYIVRLKL